MEFKLLTDVLDNLDKIEDSKGNLFKPRFDYGTKRDLLMFLSMKKRGPRKTNTYPLIWLETPIKFVKTNRVETARVNFILAVNSSNEITNRKRTEISFVAILDPLKILVEKAINAHSATRINKDNQSISKIFNYDSDSSKGTSDIWDVISFEVDLQINLDCIN